MTESINGVNLDAKALRVLLSIEQNGGMSNTSKVKSDTDIDDNEIVKYRFRKLEEAGFVELRQPSVDENGQLPPLEVIMTDLGETAVETLDLEEEISEGDSTEDLDDLAETVGENSIAVTQVEHRLDALVDALRESSWVEIPDEIVSENEDRQDNSTEFDTDGW